MFAASLAGNRLFLILLPTEACNFRCIYCYEKRENGRMEAPVLQGVKNLLTRRAANLEVLRIAWFGGEPLLARDIIEEVHRHVQGLLEEHSQIRFSADITTNAYLLSREVFEDLLKCGVTQYQISFDGPREWHDRKCMLPGGKGTFTRIWDHVTALRDVPGEFKVILRIHVDEDNAEAIPDFITRCRDVFGGDPRFQFFIRALSRLGGSRDHQIRALEGGLQDKRIEALRKLASSMGLNEYCSQTPFTLCYAVQGNCFVVRADGRINKCTVSLEHPENQMGRLHENGTMTLNRERMLVWMRGLFSGDSEVLRCQLIGFPDPCAEAHDV